MKSENIMNEYIEYKNKIGNRKAIYRTVVNHFDIETVLYPGSHIDIALSFIIPKVIYVDNFKGAIGFLNIWKS